MLRHTQFLRKPRKPQGGFTLVEIMIVVAIIALLAAIAVPGFLRARKRSQATRVLDDLRIIDAAIDQYAIETSKEQYAPVAWTDIQKYIKKDTNLYTSGGNDLFDHSYFFGLDNWWVDVGLYVPWETYYAMQDVIPDEFWSPYGYD